MGITEYYNRNTVNYESIQGGTGKRKTLKAKKKKIYVKYIGTKFTDLEDSRNWPQLIGRDVIAGIMV